VSSTNFHRNTLFEKKIEMKFHRQPPTIEQPTSQPGPALTFTAALSDRAAKKRHKLEEFTRSQPDL
jgi:hypothetical protein